MIQEPRKVQSHAKNGWVREIPRLGLDSCGLEYDVHAVVKVGGPIMGIRCQMQSLLRDLIGGRIEFGVYRTSRMRFFAEDLAEEAHGGGVGQHN